MNLEPRSRAAATSGGGGTVTPPLKMRGRCSSPAEAPSGGCCARAGAATIIVRGARTRHSTEPVRRCRPRVGPGMAQLLGNPYACAVAASSPTRMLRAGRVTAHVSTRAAECPDTREHVPVESCCPVPRPAHQRYPAAVRARRKVHQVGRETVSPGDPPGVGLQAGVGGVLPLAPTAVGNERCGRARWVRVWVRPVQPSRARLARPVTVSRRSSRAASRTRPPAAGAPWPAS